MKYRVLVYSATIPHLSAFKSKIMDVEPDGLDSIKRALRDTEAGVSLAMENGDTLVLSKGVWDQCYFLIEQVLND